MGVAIPQLAPASPDRASGAQVINGSMMFKGFNYLTRTPSGATNRKTWTFSAWVKRWAALDEASNYSTIFGANSDGMELFFSDDGTLNFYDYSGGGYQARLATTERFRDPTGWYHIVAVSDTTDALDSFRWRLYVNGKRITQFGTESYPSINYDTGVNSTGLHVLGRYGTGADTVRKAKLYQTNNYLIDGLALGPGYFGYTDPLSGEWKPKKFRAQGTTVNDGKVFSSTGTFSNWDDDGSYPKTELFDGTIYSGGTPNGASSDSSSAATFDFGEQRITGFSNLKINIFLSSNQASTPNLVSVNGRDITNECHAAGNDEWTTVDLQDKFTTLQSFSIANNNIYVGGFIVDEVIMKDSTTENLAFGDNGFYMPFEDQSDFEKDKSGNGNDFTKNGFTGTETDPDIVKDSPAGPAFGGVPTSGVTTTSAAPGNYCTFNPLDKYSGITLDTGNLTLDHSSGSTIPMCRSTIGMRSGKWYFEVTRGTGTYGTMGIATRASDLSMYAGRSSNAVGGYEIYTENTEKWAGGSGGSSSGYLTVPWDSDGDVASCYFDADNGTIGFKVNGTDMGIAFTGIDKTKTYFFQCGSQGTILHANFGQKPFKYAPPEGYSPLSYNSVGAGVSVSIPNAKQYVGVATYIGNVTARDIKMEGLAPDLVWIKSRPSSYHILTDSVRGVNKQLYSNTADTEASNTDRLASFNKDGFSLDANTSSGGVNTDNYAYVAWAWRAGGSRFTYNKDGGGSSSASDIGVSATTLTLTGASINTTSKFGIYAYTGSGSGGATINHGLGGTPTFMMYKKRNGSTSSWQVYHTQMGGSVYATLDENADKYQSDSTRWGGTDPTSTTITLGTHANSAHNVILYAWCDVPGLQKFGHFVGGGSDYPFIELGFSPALVIIKNVDTGGTYYDWQMVDNKRDPFNIGDDNANSKNFLFANTNAAENYDTSPWNNIDFLSNGFRVNDSSVSINKDGDTLIYAAWAEAPSFNLFGGGANAF